MTFDGFRINFNTQPETELRLKDQLTAQKIKENVALLKKLKAEQREVKRLANKSERGRGRQPLDDALIARAREKAKSKPLKDVALSLGISLRSMYNKGISRKALDAEKANQTDS